MRKLSKLFGPNLVCNQFNIDPKLIQSIHDCSCHCRINFRLILDQFLIDFEWTLDYFWINFEPFLAQNWDKFWPVDKTFLKLVQIYFKIGGKLLSSFLDQHWIKLGEIFSFHSLGQAWNCFEILFFLVKFVHKFTPVLNFFSKYNAVSTQFLSWRNAPPEDRCM